MTTHQRLKRTMRNPARARRSQRNYERQLRNGRGHGAAAWGPQLSRAELDRMFFHGTGPSGGPRKLPKWLAALPKPKGGRA